MTKALTTLPDEDQVQDVMLGFPKEQGFVSNSLPRLGMYSQDKFEGKGKQAKSIQEAGIFFVNKQDEEEAPVKNEETGATEMKKQWHKEDIGTEIEGTIIHYRRQLKFFDSANDSFISSIPFDDDSEVIPLYQNGAEVASGTPAELKEQFMGVDERTGKKSSNLKENRILYVLYEGEVYEMTLGGSSMFNMFGYLRKSAPPASLTRFSSEERKQGSNEWNAMTFETVRPLTKDEFALVVEKGQEIKSAIAERKAARGDADREFAAYTPAKKEEKTNLRDLPFRAGRSGRR